MALQEVGLPPVPAFLETEAGERGKKLSGGQRWRLALARALLGRAPLMIFDEPGGALDAEGRAGLGTLLTRLKGDHTLLVITHDPEAVSVADHVVTWAQGGAS